MFKRRDGFICILIAAVFAAFLLIAAGVFLYNKIIESANNKNNKIADNLNKNEPEILAVPVAVSEYEPEFLDDNYNENNNEDENYDYDYNYNLKDDVKKVINVKPDDIKKDSKSVAGLKSTKNSNKNAKNLKNNNKTDLSAYKVNPIRASEGDFMPDDKSVSVKELNAAMKANKNKSEKFDGGRGLLGDIYRGAKKIVDEADAMTLNTSKKVLNDVADINVEDAKLRPEGGGVKLHLDIAPKTNKDKNKNQDKTKK